MKRPGADHNPPHTECNSQIVRQSRRRLLKSVSGLATSAVTWGQRARAAESFSPVMARLSSYMSGTRDRLLPPEVIEDCKHHLLDTLAAMISGSELQPGRTALKFARLYPGKAAATVVASNIVCGPMEAALANAMLAHSDETDDSHAPSLSHPGCAVVPAALAAGELFNIRWHAVAECRRARLRHRNSRDDDYGRARRYLHRSPKLP